MNRVRRALVATAAVAAVTCGTGCFPLSTATLNSAAKWGWQDGQTQIHKCFDWVAWSGRSYGECPDWARHLEP